jgi:acyl carrier protein
MIQQAYRQQDSTSALMDVEHYPPSQEVIETWLIERLAAELDVSPESIDTDTPFQHYGLGSVQIVGIIGDLEEWLRRSLSPTLGWNFPCVAALAQHLAAPCPVDTIDEYAYEPF